MLQWRYMLRNTPDEVLLHRAPYPGEARAKHIWRGDGLSNLDEIFRDPKNCMEVRKVRNFVSALGFSISLMNTWMLQPKGNFDEAANSAVLSLLMRGYLKHFIALYVTVSYSLAALLRMNGQISFWKSFTSNLHPP